MNATPAHVADLPMVVRTSIDTVVLELSGPHAEVLANILARYDAIAAGPPQGLSPIRHFTPDVWQHTLIRLLSEVAQIKGNVAETVDVDVSDVDLTRRRPQLQVVGGGRA